MRKHRSVHMDLRRPASLMQAVQASAVAAAQALPSMVLGVVEATDVEEPELPGGWVRVGIPHPSPTSTVTGRTDGGLTAVGAVVAVLLDHHGRVLQITSPISLPEDGIVRATGAVGARVLETQAEASQALARVGEARQAADAAQAAANQAAGDVVEALRVAESKGRFSVTEPADAPVGAVWFVLDASGHVIDVRVKGESGWVSRPLVASQVIVPGSAGTILLEDGAVTAPKVQASEELWAKIARFASVTTEMLTAGNATILGTAVVGDLIGNDIQGARLSGGTFELDDVGAAGQAQGVRSEWLVVDGDPATDVAGTDVMAATFAAQHIADSGHLAYRRPLTGSRPVKDLKVSLRLRTNVEQTLTVSVATSGTTRVSESVTLKAGAPVDVTIPVGDVTQPAGVVPLLIYPTRVSRVEVQYYAESWFEASSGSGLVIGRTASGDARIEITEKTGGGKAVLDSSGVTYRVGSTVVGSQSWRSLIAPPRATIKWPANGGSNSTSGANGAFNLSTASYKRMENGFTQSGIWLTVPVSGWYQVQVSAGFLWETTKPEWAVSTGVFRKSVNKVDWDNDPADTRALIPGVTTRPTAVGLIYLTAGEGICLGFWQNTGTWRPNRGTQVLTVQLVDAD